MEVKVEKIADSIMVCFNGETIKSRTCLTLEEAAILLKKLQEAMPK